MEEVRSRQLQDQKAMQRTSPSKQDSDSYPLPDAYRGTDVDTEPKDEESNIVTDTLGHLVGPDSARNSFNVQRHQTFPAQETSTFRTVFACLQLQDFDKIIFADFTPKAISIARAAVLREWPQGIQNEKVENSRTHVFKLKGNPWLHDMAGDASRRLVKGLIEDFYDAGWVLSIASGFSATGKHEKDSLIFRYQDPAPSRCDWMSVVLSNDGIVHRLRLIDAPADVIQIMAKALTPLTTKHIEITGSGVHEFEIKNRLIASCNGNMTLSRDIVLATIPALEQCGFAVNASIDQVESALQSDTWHCSRPVGWTPGLPVFHR